MNNIVVFGSFVVDLIARSETLPNPGQTLIATGFDSGPGGKGQNQAVQAKLLGGNVNFITKIGTDPLADIGLKFWKKINLDVLALESIKNTGSANINVDKNGLNQILVYLGANNDFSKEDVFNSLEKYNNSNTDIFLIQAENNIDATIYAIELMHQKNIKIIYNPAPFREMPKEIIEKCFLITPNETEAASMLNIPKIDLNNAEEKVKEIASKFNIEHVIITLGSNGCVYNQKNSNQVQFFKPPKINAIDTVGAGDSFSGTLAFALSNQYSMTEAIKLAINTSAYSTLFKGSATSMGTFDDVQKFTQQINK